MYFFGGGKAEGNGKMKDVLGGKGAGLAEMTNAGLPVPPGFTIQTEACREYMRGALSPEVDTEMYAALERLEKLQGQKLGAGENPLLVSVRSGAKFSMPGMMDTILNLGLNDQAVEALAKLSNNPRFAYDSYRRLIQMFGDVVLDVEKKKFEHIFDGVKAREKVKFDYELKPEALKEIKLGMNKFSKLALILAGYVAAMIAAFVGVELKEATDPVEASGGMQAFGDFLSFCVLFGLFSLALTAIALYHLRRSETFWRVFSSASLVFAATGPILALLTRRLNKSDSLLVGFFALLRVLATPLLCSCVLRLRLRRAEPTRAEIPAGVGGARSRRGRLRVFLPRRGRPLARVTAPAGRANPSPVYGRTRLREAESHEGRRGWVGTSP